jgi:hypothetical protein
MSARDRTIIGLVVVVVVAIGGWLFLVQPKRDKASSLATQVNAVQSQLDTVRSQLAQAEAARSTFSGSYGVLARLGEAVPADDNVPSLIYQIQNAATQARVNFNALALGSSGSGGASSSTRATPGAASPAAALPPGATIGPAGFPIEPFSFTFTGNFFHLADFFGRLQRFVVVANRNISVSGRLMTLDAINLAAGPSGFPTITAKMSATTYLLPASQGLTAGATPLGPGPTATSSTASSVTAAAAVTSPLR